MPEAPPLGVDAVPAEFVGRAGLPVLTWPAFERYGVDAVVTTRHGGVSSGAYESLNLGLHVGDDRARVLENRRRAAAAIGLTLDDLVFCAQAHGREVRWVGEGDRGRGARTADDAVEASDALVTDTPGLGLVVLVADCVPLVLLDPASRLLAVVHAGWRGTLAQVTPAAVEAMAARGACAERLVAAIGPAIAPQAYEVGEDVAEAAASSGDTVARFVRPHADGRYRFDLWGANRRQLLDAGVAPERVLLAALPTGGGGPFFSHRAAAPGGRFGLLARLRG